MKKLLNGYELREIESERSDFFEAKNSLNLKQNQGVRKDLCLKSILKPSDDRWCKYRDMILGILKRLSDLE